MSSETQRQVNARFTVYEDTSYQRFQLPKVLLPQTTVHREPCTSTTVAGFHPTYCIFAPFLHYEDSAEILHKMKG